MPMLVVLVLSVFWAYSGGPRSSELAKVQTSAQSTEQVLRAIERQARPLFPLNVQGRYTLNLTGRDFSPLRANDTFSEGGAVDGARLRIAATRLLDPSTARLFDGNIDSTLFFLNNSKRDVTLARFVTPTSLERKIELSMRLTGTSTSCAGATEAVSVACEWEEGILTIPISSTTVQQSAGNTYVHGGMRVFSDLAGATVIVCSCLGLKDVDSRSSLIARLNPVLDTKALYLTVAGGDSFRQKQLEKQLEKQ
jgi:hypothetical protein